MLWPSRSSEIPPSPMPGQKGKQKPLPTSPRDARFASRQDLGKPSTPTQKVVGRLARFTFIAVSLLLACVLVLVPRGIPKDLQQSAYALCSPDEPRIYTVDHRNSVVQCIVVHGSRILDVGNTTEIRDRWNMRVLIDPTLHSSKSLQVKYLPPEAIVVPGLSDSHAHILEYGASQLLPLESARNSQQVVLLVKKFILAHPTVLADPSSLVEGWGWDHTVWPEKDFPNAIEFEADPVTRGRSIILQSKDGHALWVSNRIMENISDIPDSVEGGVIVRDPDEKPTGVFLDNAQELIKKQPLTEKDLMIRFKKAIDKALSVGLTSIHDAGFDPASLEFFRRRADDGSLPIRIYGMRYFDDSVPYNGDTTPKIMREGNGRLISRSIKIFADGALRSGGAALHAPYTDHPHTKGFMRISPTLLHSVIPKYLRDGWQVNVHAIGDRANGIVLDAFETALDGVDVAALRPRLEHAQMMTDEDISRLGRLGVIASIQPTHAISDMWYAEDRLGPDRVKKLYAFRSLVENGVRITLGSDAPVEDINPLAGFYAAVTRLSPDGRSPLGSDGWFPEQRLSRVEALRGMTIDPAYASFTESILGSLEREKVADFVILSQNIMTIPVKNIPLTKVLATIIDGMLAYGQL